MTTTSLGVVAPINEVGGGDWHCLPGGGALVVVTSTVDLLRRSAFLESVESAKDGGRGGVLVSVSALGRNSDSIRLVGNGVFNVIRIIKFACCIGFVTEHVENVHPKACRYI